MAIEKLPEEAYAVLDRLDEAMISSELAGLVEYGAQELIYSFKIEGREVTGLSWPGAKALARWMAEKGHPLDAEEKDITQDEDSWYADVKVVDKATGLGLWGTSKARKMKQIHVVNDNRDWVKNADGSWKFFEKPDEHSRTIALNKAQRNAICAHVPDKMIAQFIKQAIEEGRVRDVPPDEVESYRQRKQVDSEEVKRIRAQARKDREERLAREAEEREKPPEEEPEPEEEEPLQGPQRSFEDVTERLASVMPGYNDLVKVTEYEDYYRIGRRLILDKDVDDHLDILVSEMGGEFYNEKNEWRIPKNA